MRRLRPWLFMAMIAFAGIVLAACDPTPAPPADTPIPPTEVATPVPGDFFVSRSGDNSNGLSWATAWNELDQIDWDVVSGELLIAEGVYGTPLVVQKSVAVRAVGDVVLFGGRETPLPYCGQTDWSGSTANYNAGIEVKASDVSIDGGDWSGIVIYGFGRHGISISNVSNVLVRNVEIYDNGIITTSGDPDQPGVNLRGTNVTFERALIHDNGQDAFQSSGLSNFTLRESWLYNERKQPNGKFFNECRHSDGIQIWNGGVQSGVTITESVIGPGFMQGVLLGGNAASGWASIRDVVISDVLFIDATNASIHSHDPPVDEQNWLIENVTAIRDVDDTWWNVVVGGFGHVVRDSVFVGGRSNSISAQQSGNCNWDATGSIGPKVDPQMNGYEVTNPACIGSDITSVEDLLSR